MRSKRAIIGIMFLGLAAHANTLARAQDSADPFEPIASVDDALKAADPAMGDCAASCSPVPTRYGYAETMFLQRNNSSSDQAVIVQTQGPTYVATVVSTSDLDFEFDPAVRVVLGHRLPGNWAVEGTYLGLCDADTLAFVAAPNEDTNLSLPGTLPFAASVFPDMNRAWVSYSSALHSAELNFVCSNGCGAACGADEDDGTSKGTCGASNLRCLAFEWFVGFRYVNLGERFNIDAERDQQVEGSAFAVEYPGVYDIRTSNNMFGPQLGARLRRSGERLGGEATGKAGIFGNSAHQEQFVIDYPGYPESFPLRPETSAADGHVAFVGELNLTGLYRLTDVWNLRAGYHLIWIAGVALAPDQLDFDDEIGAGGRLDCSGSLFLHGVSCGVEAAW